MEPLVEEVVLEALSGRELELAASALEKLAGRARELDEQWRKRLEGARYEAEKAARRYHQVEPENRLVARTLEGEWNARLEEVARLEREYGEIRSKPPFELTPEQRRKILALAQDVPALWRAPTTKNSQRKKVVRLLIEDVTLRNVDEPWIIEVAVRWRTGAVTRHRAERVLPHPQATAPEVVQRIAELRGEKTDRQIAEILNAEGLRSGYGKPFTASRVMGVRRAQGLTKSPERRTTAPEVVARIRELAAGKTDRKIAEILNAEGLRSGHGRTFTRKGVAHVRLRQDLRKLGPRRRRPTGDPRSPREVTDEGTRAEEAHERAPESQS